MDPMAVDMLVCLDVGQWSDKTQLNDALGAEVKEIVGYQAPEGPSPYSIGRVRDISVCLSFDSEVIQFPRYTLMAKRLFGDVGFRLFLRLLVGVLSRFLRNLFGLSGFDPKRTLAKLDIVIGRVVCKVCTKVIFKGI